MIRIAAAQSPSVAGDITANIGIHLQFIAAARAAEVQLLVFPELSLSGYELPLARACALTPEDRRLAPLRAAAQEAGMTVIVGAPVFDPGAGQPCIATLAFRPDGSTTTYRKQYLHDGEERYVQPGPWCACAQALGGHRYVEAICADTTHPEHAQAAAGADASLYVAGVLITPGGYDTDAGLMQSYAAGHRMGVLMANHAAPSGGYTVAGKSAFWAPGGALVAQAEGTGNYLVIVEENSVGWQGRAIPVNLE